MLARIELLKLRKSKNLCFLSTTIAYGTVKEFLSLIIDIILHQLVQKTVVNTSPNKNGPTVGMNEECSLPLFLLRDQHFVVSRALN